MSILTKEEILTKLNDIKPDYENEGLILLGFFGSYARNEANEDSDIDILYDIDDKVFLAKYPAFRAFSRLTQFKNELKEIFHKNIDIADRSTLSEHSKKYILRDVIYAK